MNPKKIGIWAGGILGSFAVLLVLAYFLFPYLNPDKAKMVQKQQESKMKAASFEPENVRPKSADALDKKIAAQKMKIDSLIHVTQNQAHVIDSLRQVLSSKGMMNEDPAKSAEPSSPKEFDSTAVKKASQSLLRLDEESLSPIVNLLEQRQLISLYEKGSGRQRQKLLRTLSPKKAANILKKVM